MPRKPRPSAGDQVIGLAHPPMTQHDFVEFSDVVIKSRRIAEIFAA
jgi:hypothetical protein